jgi:beta-galactosidase
MLYNQTLLFPNKLDADETYVLAVLIDQMGLDEDTVANTDIMKDPQGNLDYDLEGRDKSVISWKITGNLGGEAYFDLSRGPLNEGALFAERQGYHLPSAPIQQWAGGSPFVNGLSAPGVGFFTSKFNLRIPNG